MLSRLLILTRNLLLKFNSSAQHVLATRTVFRILLLLFDGESNNRLSPSVSQKQLELTARDRADRVHWEAEG